METIIKSDHKEQSSIERSPSEKVLALSKRRIFSGRADREMIRVLTFAAFAPILAAIPGVGRAQSLPQTSRSANFRIVERQEDPRRMVEWERIADFRINDNGEASSAQPTDAGTSVNPAQPSQSAQLPQGGAQASQGSQGSTSSQAPPVTKVVTPAEPQAHQNQPVSLIIPAPKAYPAAPQQSVSRQSAKRVVSTKLPGELPGTSIVGS